MPKKTLSYEDDLSCRLQDPKYAALYINEALQDEDTNDALLLLALRDVARAHNMSLKLLLAALDSGLA